MDESFSEGELVIAMETDGSNDEDSDPGIKITQMLKEEKKKAQEMKSPKTKKMKKEDNEEEETNPGKNKN
jgi:hypothetical protein